jgi:RNA polymerase sigma-70 factor (ECF subfamily)
VTLDEALVVSGKHGEDLVARRSLAEVGGGGHQKEPSRGDAFFGGLSVEETAEVLKVSSDTVLRDWRLAKLWLLRELSGEKHDQP